MNVRVSFATVLFASLFFLFACGGSTNQGSDGSDVTTDQIVPVPDQQHSDQSASDTNASDTVAPGDADATGQDSADSSSAPDTLQDASGTDVNQPFGGTPCESHEDCNSGYCAPTPDGKICSETCDDDCPEGWSCREFEGDDKYCMNDDVNLCRPCVTNEDCLSGGGAPGDFCVNLGPYNGSFCGTSCGSSSDCPGGYECRSVELGGPQPVVQLCLPMGDQCACSDWAIEDEASTVCGIGTCFGTRECLPNGTLLACSAQEGGLEICDSIDNDCDGETDENFTGVGNPCDGPDNDFCFGGLWTCNDDPTNELLVCTDGAGDSIEEYCDGQDNDCDGETDEDFPDLGLPCDGPDPDQCENGSLGCSEDLRDLVCVEDESLNQIEDCNGLDDDCDGETDEGDICAGGPNTQEAVVALDGIEGVLYRSLNHGVTWEEYASLPVPTPALINMTRSGTATLYVFSSQSKLVASEDAGLTWTEKSNWGTVNNFTICAHPTQDILYGTDSSGLFYKSTDKAASFELVGEWNTFGSSIDCAVNPDGVIVVTDANYANAPVHISLDGGQSFDQGGALPKTCYETGTLCDNDADCGDGGYCEVGGGNNASLTTDGQGAFYTVGNRTIFRSVDGGVTWEWWGLVPGNAAQSIQDIIAGDNGYLYGASANAGSLGGHFHQSADAGVAWNQVTDWKAPSNSSGWVEIETVYVPITAP